MTKLNYKALRIIRFLTIFSLLIFGKFATQGQALIKVNNLPPPSFSSSTFVDYNGNLGVGITVPVAKVHVYSNLGFTNQPLFKTELWSGTYGIVGSLQNFIKVGNINYGIYQTGNGLFNYFQNPTGIGIEQPNYMLDVGGTIHTTNDVVAEGNNYFKTANCGDGVILNGLFNTQPYLQCNQNSMAVIMTRCCGKQGPCYYHLMDLTGAGETKTVAVNGLLSTQDFQLTDSPSKNFILMSDANGNGRWTNPSSLLDNYWLLNPNNGLYTMKSVGIGTTAPVDKLQVNDGISKIVLGTGPQNILPEMPTGSNRMSLDGCGYLGFNTHYLPLTDQWAVSGNGVSNAGSLIFNGPSGDMYFSVFSSTSGDDNSYSQNDIDRNAKMRICPAGGVIMGEDIVSNSSTNAALEIRSKGNGAGILLNAQDDLSTESHPISIVMKNLNSLFALGLDAKGKLNLSEWLGRPLMTFHFGRVGIGHVDLDSCDANSPSKLWVEGGITTQEVIVKDIANWPDFVFNNDYKMQSISDLEKYIETNKHLPDIPSTNEIKTDGIELGKMNSLLLQKIEELSLYVIDQQKQIVKQQKQIDELKKTVR